MGSLLQGWHRGSWLFLREGQVIGVLTGIQQQLPAGRTGTELRPAQVHSGVGSPGREGHSQEARGQQQPLASWLVREDILQEVVDVAHSYPCERAMGCLRPAEAPQASVHSLEAQPGSAA